MLETYIEKNPGDLARNFYQASSHPNAGGWSESILHLRKIYKEHKSKPIPVNFKSRLDGPSVSWEVFRRLNPAITYADSHTKDCMIFSFEERNLNNSGQRLFLVTHPQHLWLNYKSRPLETRCTYEVIREGVPCKLYFDLEFYKMYNSHKDGIKMTKIFIECIIVSMLEDFNLKISASDIIWLDASTEKKYSCHLILQRNDLAFKNNIEAGDFVSSLICKIKRKTEGHSDIQFGWPPVDELKYMFVQDSDGRSVHFCDAGVYTKNRNFRLFLSTKYGKNAPLLLSPHNQYIPITNKVITDENEVTFYDSLCTFFRNACNFTRLLSYDIERIQEKIPNNALSRRQTNISDIPQNSKSPYPEVDSFVLSLIKDDKTMGFIRKWSYLQIEDILTYEIGNYRFCHNIGRQHKSNNIMIIVDMKRKIYYQKCHDPECRAQCYKSISQNLPENIRSLYSVPDDFFESYGFSQLENDPHNELTLTNKKSIKNEGICDDDFSLNDLSLDSYPFTQLQNFDRSCCDESINKESSICKTVNKNQNLEDRFLDDTTFDDLCMGDLDFKFGKSTTESGNLNLPDFTNFFESTFSEDSVKDVTGEEMSSEDELIMAEAAAALEISMDESWISEETIF